MDFNFAGLNIGFALTGSHCTIEEVLPIMRLLTDQGAKIVPILSPSVINTDTRFHKAKNLIQRIQAISGTDPLGAIAEAEPIGPEKLLDLLLIAPCTGNTLAKIAHGITDTSVTMACKAQLRNSRPVVLAISTNDGLGANAYNLGLLLNRKNIYFTPFGQDQPHAKQTSLIAKMNLIPETIAEALKGRQIQPLLIAI